VPWRLAAADVHVWHLQLDETRPHRDRLDTLLSTDERARAARLVLPEVRDRFVMTRAVLRCLLGRYLGTDPRQLSFRYGAHGKPELDTSGSAAIHFNASHSHDVALFAVTLGRGVGIDVERIRAGVACDDLAQRFFAPEEVARLRALPEAERRRAFFQSWARQEAVVKARGDGLTRALDGESRWTVERWRVEDVDVRDDYAAAVAVEGHDWQMTWYSQPPLF